MKLNKKEVQLLNLGLSRINEKTDTYLALRGKLEVLEHQMDLDVDYEIALQRRGKDYADDQSPIEEPDDKDYANYREIRDDIIDERQDHMDDRGTK